jgi:hypothetical protein
MVLAGKIPSFGCCHLNVASPESPVVSSALIDVTMTENRMSKTRPTGRLSQDFERLYLFWHFLAVMMLGSKDNE